MSESRKERAEENAARNETNKDSHTVMTTCRYEDNDSFDDTNKMDNDDDSYQVDEILEQWNDRNVSRCLCALGPEEKDKIINSMRLNGPVLDTIVHDKRYQCNDLIARTKDIVFVFDMNLNKITDFRVISKASVRLWPLRDYITHLTLWPQCDKIKFKDQIDNLKLHVNACYAKLCKEK